MHYLECLMLFTGARRSEALAVDIKEDFDFENKEITFKRRMLFNKNSPYIRQGLKNGEKQKVIPMLKPIYELFFPLKNIKGIYFNNKNTKKYFTRGSLRYWWEKYQSLYGLNFSQHRLRHTFATICYKSTLDIKVTLDTYTHIDKTFKKEQNKNLQKYVAAMCK